MIVINLYEYALIGKIIFENSENNIFEVLCSSLNSLQSVEWCSELGNQSQTVRRGKKFSANTSQRILRSASPPAGLLPHEI
jgi:hypothetical protein